MKCAVGVHERPRSCQAWVALDRGSTPSAWFLPGPICMRGGAARDFASDRHFHRGIHLESTLVEKVAKSDSRSKACVIPTFLGWILFSEAREASFRKPLCGKPASGSHLFLLPTKIVIWCCKAIFGLAISHFRDAMISLNKGVCITLILQFCVFCHIMISLKSCSAIA